MFIMTFVSPFTLTIMTFVLPYITALGYKKVKQNSMMITKIMKVKVEIRLRSWRLRLN